VIHEGLHGRACHGVFTSPGPLRPGNDDRTLSRVGAQWELPGALARTDQSLAT